jgi:hypothetical protein
LADGTSTRTAPFGSVPCQSFATKAIVCERMAPRAPCKATLDDDHSTFVHMSSARASQ